MLSYLIRRIILVLPVAFGVSVICFLLVQIAPGDPLTAIMPVDATAEEQAWPLILLNSSLMGAVSGSFLYTDQGFASGVFTGAIDAGFMGG